MDNERVQKRLEKIKADADSGGYTLNPDNDFVLNLVEGLVANKDRYGMESCPCRLFVGAPEDNTDILCPCIYRDDDLAEYGACFCALYVSPQAPPSVKQIPERRPPLAARTKKQAVPEIHGGLGELAYPVYRCTVYGYLCANNNPPHTCPICKAGKERFERFI